MVKMRMRNDGEVDLAKVNIQCFNIPGKGVCIGSSIKQNNFPFVIDDTGKPKIKDQAWSFFTKCVVKVSDGAVGKWGLTK